MSNTSELKRKLEAVAMMAVHEAIAACEVCHKGSIEGRCKSCLHYDPFRQVFDNFDAEKQGQATD